MCNSAATPLWETTEELRRFTTSNGRDLRKMTHSHRSELIPVFLDSRSHARATASRDGPHAAPKQINSYMVEQSGEPFLLPIFCYLPHTVKPLEHTVPALRRAHARWNDLLPGLRALPSPISAEGCPSLFD